jgi:hypothetical protein
MQWSHSQVMIRRPTPFACTVSSVRADAPIEAVVAVMNRHQLRSVSVVDEYGVPVGTISLADLLPDTGGVDPWFAGLARRHWYDLPAGATARDLMISSARVAVRRWPSAVQPAVSRERELATVS